MITLNNEIEKQLINLAAEKNIFLEGNVTKLIVSQPNSNFGTYIQDCINRDKENRRKRLEITKTIQQQNKELIEWKSHNEKLSKADR
jgi:hypothetical protein